MNLSYLENEFVKNLNAYFENPLTSHGEQRVKRLLRETIEKLPTKVVEKVKVVKELQILPPPTITNLPPQRIIELVSNLTGITVEEMTCRIRKGEFVKARYLAFVMLYRYCDISLSKIGKLFGRDHTTVLHGIREFENRCVQEEGLRGLLYTADQLVRKELKTN